MADSQAIAVVRQKFEALVPVMDERVRRRWAATEAVALGWGGITTVAAATGLSPSTIKAGISELHAPLEPLDHDGDSKRVRRVGGGRKPLAQSDHRLIEDLRALVESTTRGHPESPLLWTCKSTRNLADELASEGHQISHVTVASLLQAMDYRLQSNRKVREGEAHPDRNAQFEYIGRRVRAFQRRGQPVVSVDTKKKELVGDFKNKSP
jgi:Rhodopirellula transposase DDE domain